jgi:hypothetical protein
MSSDEAYASFLDKVNQPLDSAASKPSQTQSDRMIQSQQQSATVSIPSSLRSLNATLTSESDEPFEPFAIPYQDTGLPDAAGFARAMRAASQNTIAAGGKGQDGESGEDEDEDEEGGRMEELKLVNFDPRGEYGEVVEAVRRAVTPTAGTTATSGKDSVDVRCYREERRKKGSKAAVTRVIYYLVGLDVSQKPKPKQGKKQEQEQEQEGKEQARLVGVKALSVES